MHHIVREKQRKTHGQVFQKRNYLHEAIMHMWLKSCIMVNIAEVTDLTKITNVKSSSAGPSKGLPL